MSQPWIIDSVASSVKKIPNHAGFKVLGLSCGDGQLLEIFDQLGWRVEGHITRAKTTLLHIQEEYWML